MPDPVPLQTLIEAACIAEARAPKLGNVHPAAEFSDLRYQDFLDSARVVAPILARTSQSGVGQAILQSAQATWSAVGTNTNLGILLLLAPLAAIPRTDSLRDQIPTVLDNLDVQDAELVYAAIRCLHPGGLGRSDEQDVSQPPTVTLKAAMSLAADRDLIARQYDSNFELVLGEGVEVLITAWEATQDWDDSLVALQLHWLATQPDTLIARQHGLQVAIEVQQRVAESIYPEPPWIAVQDESRWNACRLIDQWMRQHQPRLNPGAIADLICATTFAAVRDHGLPLPV